MPVLDYRDGSAAEARILNMLSAISSLVRRTLPAIGSSRTGPPPSLAARDSMIAIPTVYYGLDSGPSPGTVVGATLGSVAGFILLVWLIQTLTNNNRRDSGVEEEVIVRRERSPRKRSRRSEMRSVSRSSRPERVIRQERIVRDSSRAPPAMPRSSFIVDERTERRVEGDDVVEVIEEHSDIAPPRRKSRRGSGGYRSVEPLLYAGGNYPQ